MLLKRRLKSDTLLRAAATAWVAGDVCRESCGCSYARATQKVRRPGAAACSWACTSASSCSEAAQTGSWRRSSSMRWRLPAGVTHGRAQGVGVGRRLARGAGADAGGQQNWLPLLKALRTCIVCAQYNPDRKALQDA
jgi:hypothetical protein